MAHKAVGHGAGQLAGASLHAPQVHGRRHRLVVGSGVEVGLQTGDPVVRAVVVGGLAGRERVEAGPHRTDEVAQSADGVLTERHGVAVLDVLPDLRPEAQLEPTAAQLGQVPGGVGDQRGAADEGERHARAHRDPLCVLRHEQGNGECVVHGLGHVQAVVPEGFDPRRTRDDVG